MKIVIAGGTGFVGRHLLELLIREGHSVIILSRHPEKFSLSSSPLLSTLQWDGRHQDKWAQTCEGADVVVNLSGASIADSRWTDKRKQVLAESRVASTRTLLQAIQSWSTKPHTFISASGVGFYGDPKAAIVDETSKSGRGFLAELCRTWEAEALQGETIGIRVLPVRFGMVLGLDGGALPKMMFPFKLFLGGPVLPGSQYVSWIHQDDLSRMILWLSMTPSIAGPVNGVAPEPVTMRQFCAALGQAMHRPSVLPVPEFVLRIGLGEMSTVLTTGQRAHPKKALEGRFSYSYPTIQSALHSLMGDA
ncbi:MAG: TIGR01777 family oxidoreductase [Nitrospirales bacterium]|nr:TIGR01777 family oxidoreductase [Nitrospirales bacterium]